MGHRARRERHESRPGNHQAMQIAEVLKEGQEILVQIAKEPLGRNGEKLNGDFTFGPFDSTKAPAFNRWPSGLEDIQGYAAGESADQLTKQLVARPTTYLLGQVDVLPLGGFGGSPKAMAQAPTRRARGEAFFKSVTGALGAKHAAIIVPECGHNDRCIYTTDIVLPVIFPKD